MPVIEILNLRKLFGAVRAVDDISFEVNAGEILVIVGASGCGKTTTLRCLAGLEKPDGGEIRVDGKTVAAPDVFVPPERRGIGMVFQNYALWPHMTVAANISYGLKLRNGAGRAVDDAVARVVNLVGLTGLEDRFPAMLSGGQQQRVALARSIVSEPKVLLLDEPLSNLDAKLREQMRLELRALIRKLGITAIHITHDQTEAMAIADRIIYMRAGRIEQTGAPRDLYRTPANRFVADFIGAANFLDGAVLDGGAIRIQGGIELRSSTSRPKLDGGEILVMIRPESVMLSTVKPSGENVLAGQVTDEVFLGDVVEHMVTIGALRLKARDFEELGVGTQVFARIDPSRVVCLPPP